MALSLDSVLHGRLAPIIERLTANEVAINQLREKDIEKTESIREIKKTIEQLQDINAKLRANQFSIDQLRAADGDKTTKIAELTKTTEHLWAFNVRLQGNEVSIDNLKVADGHMTSTITELTASIQQLRKADAQNTAHIAALVNDRLWIDMDPADGADFDTSQEYRVLNADGLASGSALYPIQVNPRFLMFEQSGFTKSRLNYNNKGQLLHCEDGKFENAVGAPSDGVRLQMKKGAI